MVYGVFNALDQHVVTYDYGQNTKERAEEMALSLSTKYNHRYYARELSLDEYYKRMKEISEGKYR